jgi:hypothetical protein
VAAHPYVFLLVAQEIGERRDDVRAMPDQDVAGGRLEQPVAQRARHQLRHEQVVLSRQTPALRIPRARRRGSGHHQRDELPAELGLRQRAEGLRDFPSRGRHGLPLVVDDAFIAPMALSTSAACELDASAIAAVTTMPGSRSVRCGRIRHDLLAARGRQRAHGAGTDHRRGVAHQALDAGQPALLDLRRRPLGSRERPCTRRVSRG